MSEECSSGNICNDVAPAQHQSHHTRAISYLIASSLNPHNMRYVKVDTDLFQDTIDKNDSKYYYYSSCEDKVHHNCCKELPSISPQSDEVSILASPCGLVSGRNCPSDVNTDPTVCITDTQEMWSGLNKIQNTSMNGLPGFNPISCEENIVSNADKSVSLSPFNREPGNFKSCVFQYLPDSEQNMETEYQMKSLCIRPGISRWFCSSPLHEKSAENSPKSQKIFFHEKESSNSCSGWTQKQLDDVFLKICRCRVCRQCFTDVFSLNFHIFKEHEKTARPTCVRCSARFVTLYALFRHLMKHKRLLLKQKAKMTRQLQAPWPSCNSKSNFSCFDRHRIQPLIKTLDGKHKNQNLETHLTFPCGACGKVYKHKKTLMTHMKFKHLGVQKKTYKCGFCLRLFSSLWQKNNHLSWRHLGKKPYLCQFCEQGFVCLPTLKRHQRKIHTGEKPYKCLHCGQSFFEKTPLDLHKSQIHTGVFPFVCSQCGRGFVQHCYLKNHWKIHSGLRPHKCLICGKKYSKISHLKRHKISCCKKPGSKILTNATHFHVK